MLHTPLQYTKARDLLWNVHLLVFVDITGKNEHGQVFVAFSRVKEVKDLILKGFGKPRYKRIAQKRKDSKLRQVKKTLEFIEKRAAYTKKVLKKVGF